MPGTTESTPAAATTLAPAALPSLATPPRWDLVDLFDSPDDPRIDANLDHVRTRARAFEARYRDTLPGLTPGALADALGEYETLYQITARTAAFASLRFAADSNPQNGAFLQRIRERATEANLPLLFFDLELAGLPGETLDRFVADPALANYHHYLQTVRARAPFRLSEPEERVLAEQANTGHNAFVRLYEEITSNLRFPYSGSDSPMTLSELLDFQYSPDRAQRQASADALSAGLEKEARTLGFIFNTLLQDKATDDRLRGYTYPEQARHLANELAPETVATVVQTATDGYPLVARYYTVKRRLLGLPSLKHYDRYAPIQTEVPPIPYTEARDTVQSAFAGFHPDYARSAQAFFDGGWIDAEARPGKRGGAFCSYVTPDTHPFIFVNYLGKQGDVRTLAHELGHGIHSYLSRPQTFFNYHGTLPMAEVASTFAEMLVFDAQEKTTTDPQRRLALYADQLDQAIATIFRQASLYQFEQAIHAERRAHGELPVARFGELWQENVGAMFGASVELGPGHAVWWSYVRHFIATPFYVYAYTFGEMLALALYQRFREEGAATFAPAYLALLSAGGSRSPQELVTPLGVDLSDPTFWQGALALLERQITRFEALAGDIAR